MTLNDLVQLGIKNGWLRKLTQLRNRYLLAIDAAGLLIIPPLAFLLRTESFRQTFDTWIVLAAYALGMIVIKLVLFYHRGLYSMLWAYTSVHELLLVARTIGLSAIIELALAYGLLIPFGITPPGFPRSVPILSALMTFLYITSIRFSIRIIYAAINRSEGTDKGTRRVLVAGAGRAGIMVVRELQDNPDLGFTPLGFVDDSPKKGGKMICGIPVIGVLDDIPWAVSYKGVQEVIIAMPSAPGDVIRRVDRLCKKAGVPSKITPGLFDLVRGAARIESMRKIQLEDLLRRDVVRHDQGNVRAVVTGKRILITGAGGSIGSEIVRQLREFRPAQLIILGHGETSIFHIMKELDGADDNGPAVTPVIADVRDAERMEQVFNEHRPEIVFHAAAHKHVWLMEQNLPDAVTNNILGTRVMVQLAEKYAVQRFVMISSDKAVNPTSVMGVTKRIAELIVQEAANRTGTGFITVRFGNVLGSRGSVVPIIRHQITMGGPVTVTHPEVTRYFMTIPEAVHLVLQAGSMGAGGEVFVLDMGKQLKVLDVARDIIRLSGLAEGEISITFTGLKPGEKMYEELFYETDTIEATSHPMIMATRPNGTEVGGPPTPVAGTEFRDPRFTVDVATLIASAEQGDHEMMSTIIKRLVPQYTPAQEYRAADPPRKIPPPAGFHPGQPIPPGNT